MKEFQKMFTFQAKRKNRISPNLFFSFYSISFFVFSFTSLLRYYLNFFPFSPSFSSFPILAYFSLPLFLSNFNSLFPLAYQLITLLFLFVARPLEKAAQRLKIATANLQKNREVKKFSEKREGKDTEK